MNHILKVFILSCILFSTHAFASKSIALNSTIYGNIYDATDTSKKSHLPVLYYTFNLIEDTNIIIETNGELREKVYLLDQHKNILTETIHNGGTRLVKNLSEGTYTIEVTTYDSSHDDGKFTLSLQTNKPVISTPISLGSTINSELTSDSEISSYTTQHANHYSFTLTESKHIFLQLRSLLIPSGYKYSHIEMILLKNNKVLTSSTYDIADTNTHRISSYLSPGTYSIEITTNKYSAPSENFESYTLQYKENIIQKTSIELNSTIQSEWTTESGFSEANTHRSEYFEFTLEKTTEVLIKLDSENRNEMYLYNNQGQLLTHSSDALHTKIFDSNSNQNYEAALNDIEVFILDAGTYTIDATTAYDKELGSFNLTLRENHIQSTPISFNTYINANITDTSGYSLWNIPVERYTFNLYKKAHIKIATEDDNYALRLIDAYGNIIEYNRIEYISGCPLYDSCEEIGIDQEFEAGTYTIEVYSSLKFKINIDPNYFNELASWMIPIYDLLLQ